MPIPRFHRHFGFGAEFFTPSGGRPLVVGHRGTGRGVWAGDNRENSVRALRTAAEMGADWVEFDVQISADGDLVLHHDVLCDGKPIRRMHTLELLDRGLHLLDEAHQKLPPTVGFDLEVKVALWDAPGEHELDLFATVVEWTRSVQPLRPILLTSFCPSMVALTRDLPLGWLANRTSPYYESVAIAARLGAQVSAVNAHDVLHVPANHPTGEEVAAALPRLGVAVLAWDVEPEDVPTLVERGVTALCGDNVPALVAAVNAL